MGDRTWDQEFDEWDGVLEEHARVRTGSPLVVEKLRDFLRRAKANLAECVKLADRLQDRAEKAESALDIAPASFAVQKRIVRCPHCYTPMEVWAKEPDEPFSTTCPRCTYSFDVVFRERAVAVDAERAENELARGNMHEATYHPGGLLEWAAQQIGSLGARLKLREEVIERFELERAGMRADINRLCDARERVAMLIPLGEDSGTVEDNLERYIARLKALLEEQRACLESYAATREEP
jgi:hypothetical protein